MLWWCCGGANIPYYTASDCPVLSDILTLSPPLPPSPAPCPLYPQQTEQTPINQHPTPQTSTVTVPERETDLTSTRTIDARHRRRHAYLTPPTKHIPIKVGQTKTKLPDKPASPYPSQTCQRSRRIAPFSPSREAMSGQGTVQAPSPPPPPMPALHDPTPLPFPPLPVRRARGRRGSTTD